MDKDNCNYCIDSKLKYATIYCTNRLIEREQIARDIYSLVLPTYQYVFTSNSRNQKYNTAKECGKNTNLQGLGTLYDLICYPLGNISITRNNDVTHSKTTISEIIRCIDLIKEKLGIDLNYELGLDYKISNNISIKTILSDYGNGIYFTGLSNANSRGGLKPKKGFFIKDIFDETIEKDKILTDEENEQQKTNYDVFISTIERGDTDNKGNYLKYEDDLELEHKVLIPIEFEINGKILFKNKYIKRKKTKQFNRLEFSNPYSNEHWTYKEILNFIPYNSNIKKKLQNDIILIYEDNNNLVLRAPLTINSYVKKTKYNELELLKEKDEQMYNLLRYGWEYNSFKDYKYIYRQDLEYCKRWDKNSIEYKEFDCYGIGMDLGSKNGDETTFYLFGEKVDNSGLQIKEIIPITYIHYDKRIHKSLNSVQRFNLLLNLIQECHNNYKNSKYNKYLEYYNQIPFNIAIPQDGDWIEGMLETWIEDNQQYNINLIKATTHGKEWGIEPRKDKIRCTISSNYFKMNEEDIPYLWKDIWKCMNNSYKLPNQVNHLNALESFLSIREQWIPADFLIQYLKRNK